MRCTNNCTAYKHCIPYHLLLQILPVYRVTGDTTSKPYYIIGGYICRCYSVDDNSFCFGIDVSVCIYVPDSTDAMLIVSGYAGALLV